jgi:hypothetical protein
VKESRTVRASRRVIPMLAQLEMRHLKIPEIGVDLLWRNLTKLSISVISRMLSEFFIVWRPSESAAIRSPRLV